MPVRVLVVLAGTLMLAACASRAPWDSRTPRGTDTTEAIDKVLDDAMAAPAPEEVEAPPSAVTEALMPDMDDVLGTPGFPLGPARFDVNVLDADARDFFMGLVAGTPVNMVVHPRVSGTISLTMKDVSLEEVLSTVRDVYGYDYRPSSSGFVIMPADMQTRIFQVDYLNISRAGISRTRVSSGQVSQAGETSADGRRGNNSSANDTVFESGRGLRQTQATGTRIETNHEADFWATLDETLRMLVGDGDGRNVVVNSQTGVIAVRAYPDELRSVESYLASVEETAGRQVILEAKIIEVVLNDASQAGINWAAVVESGGDTFSLGQLTPAGQINADGNQGAELGGDPITIGPGNPVTEFPGETVGGALVAAVDVGDFNAFIELLESQGNTKVLSSPRVSTLNNQKAVIKSGNDEFFVTDISSDTVTGTASTTTQDVELTPFFSGVALDVTPQISGEDEITLHIHPTVSEVTDQEKNISTGDEVLTIPLAFSEVRESDSIIKAKSGQVIVIGGLMRSTMIEQVFKTPWLGDVPMFGNAFRSTRELEQRIELVILLRPVVVNDDNQWRELMRGPAERIRAMEEAMARQRNRF